MSKKTPRFPQANNPPLSRSVSVQYTGPLPPAGQYEQYERTLPGSAHRIPAMAEKEQDFRHAREPKIQEDQKKLTYRGQWFAAGLSVVFTAAAVYLALNGHEVTAGILGGSTVLGIVSIFVLRRK
jgi:uncharacterized membrane protein